MKFNCCNHKESLIQALATRAVIGLLAATVCLVGCDSAGPTGPAGPKGTAGTPGANGEPGATGKSCTAKTNADGSVLIACEDGTSVTIPAGKAGTDGKGCTVKDNGDGTKVISCADGTSVIVTDGKNGANGSNGQSCKVLDQGNGTKVITCPGDVTATVSDGKDGKNGVDGKDGANGKDGAQGPKGDPADVAAAKGTISGKITAAADGSPLAGAQIVTTPLGLQVKSGADGSFTIASAPIGAYQLAVSLAGYAATVVNNVGVVSQNTTTVGIALLADSKTGGAPVIVVTTDTLAGYNADVTLKATVTDADSDVTKLTYTWKQVQGLPVTPLATNTATLQFKTLSLPASKKIVAPARFGVVGISPDEAGNYVFALTVQDPQGHVASANVSVLSAAPSAGLRNVATGLPVYLQGDATVTSWNWTLDVSGAPGSAAKLNGATTQYPMFVPDVKGVYVLTETVAKMSLKIYAGSWAGVVGASDVCKVCHNDSLAPNPFEKWAGTKHLAGTMDRFNGVGSGAPFTQDCVRCHVVGSSPFASNGGFDDVQKTSSYVLKTGTGAWDALQKNTPELGKLAGVQCENCHGPNNSLGHSSAGLGKDDATKSDLRFGRVSMGVSVCAQCHQQGPHYSKPGNWQSSAHADPVLADRGTFEAMGTNAAHCGRCHSAQGFVLYSEQLKNGNTGYIVKPDGTAADEAFLRAKGLQRSTVEPQTCAACHNPHDAKNPKQVRLYDSIAALPNGMTGITGVGTGATCMACHNTRNGEHTDFVAATTSTSGPHAPAQTDVLYGFNAYFMPRYTPSKHLAVTDTCATCHVKIPTELQAANGDTTNHAFKPDDKVCASCHAEKVDGKALKGVIAMQMQGLETAIGGAAKTLIAAAITANGKISVRANNGSGLFSSTSSTVYNVDLTDVPVSVEAKWVGTSYMLWFTMPKAVSITWSDNTATSVTQFGAAWSAVQTPVAGKNTAVIPVASTLFKAIWNQQLLHNDASGGIHNPTFYQQVIVATTNAVATIK